MDAEQSFYGLQFYHHLAGHNQVDSIRSSGFHTFVDDGQLHLRQEWNISKAKFLTHTLFIDRFKESGPQM